MDKGRVNLRPGFKGRRSIMEYQKCRVLAREITGEKHGVAHKDVLKLCLLSPDKLASLKQKANSLTPNEGKG